MAQCAAGLVEMRIAFVTTMAGFPWGGSEKVWSRAAEAAATQQHVVLATVFEWSMEHPAVVGLQQRGVRFLPRRRGTQRTLLQRVLHRMPGGAFLQRNTPRWLEKLEDFAPDVVCISSGIHLESIDEPHLFEWLIGARVPFLVVANGNSERVFLNDETRSLARERLGAARKLVFVSRGNRELAERQLACTFPNALILENSVDRIEAQPLPWPRSEPEFALVGTLYTGFKGQDVLFQVLSRPEWQERSWTCRCYGEGPDENYLRDLLRLYDLESRVELAGHLPDVSAIWTRSHLCVVPSRAEGLPMSLLEALAAGRPAVVTDVGGNAEWVDEGETGFVAEAPTPRSFGAALERAWQARERWEEMGREAWARTTRRLDPSPGESLLKLIKSIGS